MFILYIFVYIAGIDSDIEEVTTIHRAPASTSPVLPQPVETISLEHHLLENLTPMFEEQIEQIDQISPVEEEPVGIIETPTTSITIIPKVKTPSSSSSSISSSHNELMVDDNIEPEMENDRPPTPPPPHMGSLSEVEQQNYDSGSIESITAINCKIDDDNREDSSPQETPTPPPLPPLLSLEKR